MSDLPVPGEAITAAWDLFSERRGDSARLRADFADALAAAAPHIDAAARASERERIAAHLEWRGNELDAHVGDWADIGARHEVTTIAVTLRNAASALRSEGKPVRNERAAPDA